MKTLFLIRPALAHVKWFATNTESKASADPTTFLSPTFWCLLLLSLMTISLLVWLDRKLEKSGAYSTINRFFEAYVPQASVILRIFTGASILLTWQADTVIAPELHLGSSAVGWGEFFLAVLLLTSITTPIAGAGMIALFLYAIANYGLFHMLDYVVYPAIGYFLLVSNVKSRAISGTRIPALYIGLGFSLCWVALEKLIFPQWGLNVLAQKPELTMGLPHDFFLMSAAFVEFSLGFLLLVGVLQRPLSLVITLVFFTTTVFFGKLEVIGHTLLHGALLVFIVLGPGRYYAPPIDWHQRTWMRILFAVVNFCLLLGILGAVYWSLAR